MVLGEDKKRSALLGYPEGGFLSFAETIDKLIHRYKGKIIYNTSVKKIIKKDKKLIIKTDEKEHKFNCVISTLSFYSFVNMTEGLPLNYRNSLLRLKGLGEVNLILSLSKQFLKDGTYWLGINESKFPFVAIVEHTNFIDRSNYGGEHLIYVGNYFSPEHKYFQYDANRLVDEFLPYLKKINPDFDKSQIEKSYIFKSAFTQPVIPLNYSKIIPEFETPIKGLFLANMQQVYPWDRGTNYAVELGNKVADLVIKNCL